MSQDTLFSEQHNRWQYSTAELLQARIETHQKYSERKDGWAAWLADLLPRAIGGTWLDVGSGDGTMLTELATRANSATAIVAFDQSPGMLQANRHRVSGVGLGKATFVNGDAENLPFGKSNFALVTANHMLYHVPDIGHAVGEIHRVLQPGGLFIATTNVSGNYRELGELRREGIITLGLNVPPPSADAERFALEDGAAYIGTYFSDVHTYRYDDALLFTDVDGVMRYLLSGGLYAGTSGPDDRAVSAAQWDALADWVAARVSSIIAQQGMFRVSKAAGAFVARKTA